MSEGGLSVTLRVGESAVIDVDGEEIRIEYVRAIGKQKGTVRIVAPRRFDITRSENDRLPNVTFSE